VSAPEVYDEDAWRRERARRGQDEPPGQPDQVD
jgi:hypothetical protein